MKHLHVACAIIEQAGMVLAAQRSASMTLPLKWEFPGGKIEAGEGPEDCLRRELMEKLGITIKLGEALAPVIHNYEEFTVTLYPYICSTPEGALTLHEHSAVAWMEPQNMSELDWAAADLPIIASYLARSASASQTQEYKS